MNRVTLYKILNAGMYLIDILVGLAIFGTSGSLENNFITEGRFVVQLLLLSILMAICIAATKWTEHCVEEEIRLAKEEESALSEEEYAEWSKRFFENYEKIRRDIGK